MEFLISLEEWKEESRSGVELEGAEGGGVAQGHRTNNKRRFKQREYRANRGKIEYKNANE